MGVTGVFPLEWGLHWEGNWGEASLGMGLLGLWALGVAPSSFSRSGEAGPLGWVLAPIRMKPWAKPKGSSGGQGYPLRHWAPPWGTGSFWGLPWFWIEAVSPSGLQNPGLRAPPRSPSGLRGRQWGKCQRMLLGQRRQ